MLPLPATTAKRPSFTRLEYLAAYILASLIATYLITFLFTRTEYKFPFPYVVDCIQLGIAWLASTRIASSPVVPAKTSAPVTLAYVGWLVVNPLFLINVPITQYQTFIALALPFSLALAYPILSDKLAPDALVTCFLYCFGFWISAEGASSWPGVFLGLANALFLALYAVLAKKCLATVDPWALVRHNTGWACVAMVPFSLYSWFTWQGPVPAFIDELGFWFQMVLTGLIGLGLQYLTIVLIKLGSPMMQTSAAGVKMCLQSLLAAAIFGNPLSKLGIFGIAVALVGASGSIYSSSKRK
ncbi:hypothetical protein BJV82DRAFT_662103 [Fennellomyces sp. T-0311]|nr:hypothetical protein BJV82DRAFT_662103 [Fennellomyces sp. T-0311]